MSIILAEVNTNATKMANLFKRKLGYTSNRLNKSYIISKEK